MKITFCNFQAGITVNFVSGGTPMRLLRRGGGFSSYYYSTFTNCSKFCALRMQPQSVWTSAPPSGVGDDPEFMKCYEISSSTPLNGIRLSFASQVATTDIDPYLPRMNISDYYGCLGN